MRKYTDKQLVELGLSQNLPNHVGIIMDGNGRYAQSHGLPRAMGHRAGVDRLRGIIKLSSDIGITALTLYAFSTENWKRPQSELDTLFALLVEYFGREIDELHNNGVCIRIPGNTNAFPPRVKAAVDAAVERTKNNDGLKLNIALNYGSRAELARAARMIAQEVMDGTLAIEDIDETVLSDRLYTAGLPDIDLVIRTSGEQRLSNFFMMQAAYAELIFTDVYWPDYSDQRFIESLIEFQRRNRRFGGLK
ncbi:MAG: isoprenyl transferase [Clostridia bacterium]